MGQKDIDIEDLFAPAPLPVAPLDDDQRLACLRLIRSENVGPVTFRALINYYGGAHQALEAAPKLGKRGGRTIRLWPQAHAAEELERAARIGAKPIFNIEPGYPPPLAFLDHAPPMLYVKGDGSLLAKPAIAIVGARRASAAGLKIAGELARGLAELDIITISGLARGIDAAAHRASLATGTIAVLAGGIDNIYPPEHHDLFARIADQGCLISERPPGFVPRARDFPPRNRIISGVSRGVIVVEAAKRSGSLITARNALEQGREVMAIPGHPLDPRAEGTNALLKQGATLITGPEDLNEILSRSLANPASPTDLSALKRSADETTSSEPMRQKQLTAQQNHPLEHDQTLPQDARVQITAHLSPTPITIDDLCRQTALPIQTVQIALLELALAGRLEQHGSQLVSLHPSAIAINHADR